ncbi:hypothetical protein JL193_10165 [Polaribacter batillariae]|uniref:Uncharacterized protein n=1 Tax=Polaribacter batillariae TaxID=2808900 RepID=A0ABX7SQL2_9FLAO|nr:hypothetical protein [Polaribacter batillariae]QTD36512.1 hypothetical protein JL193_10165 [Polaribacter batillariae]
MELTNEQVLQIDNYVYVSGVKFFDVRSEIVDHFASKLEEKLTANPNVDIEKEIIEIHKNFGANGFRDFIEQKKKSVKKKFYVLTLRHLKTFFTLPKIIISTAIFVALVFTMNLLVDKEMFFSILSAILLALAFRLLYNVNMRDTNKHTFLVLSLTMHFFNVFYLMVLIFNLFTRNRNNDDFLNNTSNYTQIGIFVVLLLFYWSGESVFYQNKDEMKKQYPTIKI